MNVIQTLEIEIQQLIAAAGMERVRRREKKEEYCIVAIVNEK